MKIIINMQVYQWCIRTLSSIYDEAFFGKIVIGFQVLSFFTEKSPFEIHGKILNMPLHMNCFEEIYARRRRP